MKDDKLVVDMAEAMVENDSGPKGSVLFEIHWKEFADGYLSGARSVLHIVQQLVEDAITETQNEHQAEMLEQARIIGMSGEREAQHLAQIAELKRALVVAALPLEALLMSGGEKMHCQDLQDAIHDAVATIREAVRQ